MSAADKMAEALRALIDDLGNDLGEDRFRHRHWVSAREALAAYEAERATPKFCVACNTPSACRTSGECQLPVELPRAYLLTKLQMVMPLMQEARDALTVISEVQRRLHRIAPDIADRMDSAGTFSLEDWQRANDIGAKP